MKEKKNENENIPATQFRQKHSCSNQRLNVQGRNFFNYYVHSEIKTLRCGIKDQMHVVQKHTDNNNIFVKNKLLFKTFFVCKNVYDAVLLDMLSSIFLDSKDSGVILIV